MPGYRHRYMFYMTGLPGWMRFGFSPGWGGLPPMAGYLQQTGQLPYMGYMQQMPMQISKEQEIEMLEQQADMLEQQIDAIRKRIKELKEE